MKIIEE